MTAPASARRIYLDHAATSWPKPPEVAAAIARSLTELTASAGRSGHGASLESGKLLCETRLMAARLIGVADASNLIFTSGCTAALNLVLRGLLKPGDRVLVSPMEHNSVMRPLHRLNRERGVRVIAARGDEFGRVDPDNVGRLARQHHPALAVIQHASNVNGVLQPIGALRPVLGETPLLVDAAQTLGVLPLTVEMGIDFLAASVHKGLLGPTGVGFCYVSPEHDVEPLCDGGTGTQSESTEQPIFRPDRYEAGTPNLHGIAGARGALESLVRRGALGMEKQRLTQRLIEGLRAIRGVSVLSPDDGSALCAAFRIAGQSPEETARRLETRFGILGRPGLQCAPAAHRHLGSFPHGLMRLSAGWGTTVRDIQSAVEAVWTIAQTG
ncbi:MAG: aminotransferase class V-fold PLP-dependent enzyme [Planctomycetota bacterium]